MKRVFIHRVYCLILLTSICSCDDSLERLDLVSTGIVVFNDPFATSVRGSLLDLTGSQVDDHGHVWSLTEDPRLGDNNFTSLGPRFETGLFTSTINGLEQGTSYFLRGYALIGDREVYGEVIQFSTSSLDNPVLSTGASNIKDITASLGGRVNLNNNAFDQTDINLAGHVWSTEPNPLVNQASLQIKSGIQVREDGGVFNSDLGELLPGTIYYTRAFVEVEQAPLSNSSQLITRVIYGDQIIIQTRSGN